MGKPSKTHAASTAQGKRKRITVLFSGRGSNMASLMLAAMAPEFPADICHAITDNPVAGGVDIAKHHSIGCEIVSRTDFCDRDAHEAALADCVEKTNPDLICLAGFMRILSDTFVQRFSGRIINIHPSLLPAFKGLDTHERALEAGVKLHGASVHYVDETLDGGKIIAQVAVPVLEDDNVAALSKRVLEAEHRLYPHAVRLILSPQPNGDHATAKLFSPGLTQAITRNQT